MISLTEIFSQPLEYDPAIETVKSSFSLRVVYINPNYVVSFKENPELMERSKREVLVDGLKPNVGYTQVTLSSSGQGPITFNVLGTLEQIAEKFEGAGL